MRAITENEDPDGMASALVGERSFALGAFEELRTGRLSPCDVVHDNIGSESGRKASSIIVTLYSVSGMLTRDALTALELENAYLAAAHQPLETRVEAADAVAQRVAHVSNRCILTRLLLPALDAAIRKDANYLVQLQVARAALAIERFRLAHSQLPTTLDELIPAYLPVVPEDPFASQPLHYIARKQGFTIYSVGTDREDNSGISTNAHGQIFQPGTDVAFTVNR